MAPPADRYPLYARILHAGLAIFGITAFLTGELAESAGGSPGYLLHAYLGLSLAAFLLARFLRGFVGGGPPGFAGWSPFSHRQWRLALEDVRGLARLQVPERDLHEGLAGLVQAFGLAIFAWMSATGTALFLQGGMESHALEILEELHEVGEGLIPVYLLLHVGSVFLHSIAGRPVWQRMWKFGADRPRSQPRHP